MVAIIRRRTHKKKYNAGKPVKACTDHVGTSPKSCKLNLRGCTVTKTQERRKSILLTDEESIYSKYGCYSVYKHWSEISYDIGFATITKV